MRLKVLYYAVFLSPLLTGCMGTSTGINPPGTLSPDLATGTAEVSRKYTQAAELTANPMTPFSGEPGTPATIPWTPSPGDIVAGDTGRSYEIWITSRIEIVLEASVYPKANLQIACTPDIVIGQVSNIPPVPAGFYVVRFEGVQLGTCQVRNGSFEVTINVIPHP
jgi:hypothetical protein